MAALPAACRYWISSGTGWTGASKLHVPRAFLFKAPDVNGWLRTVIDWRRGCVYSLSRSVPRTCCWDVKQQSSSNNNSFFPCNKCFRHKVTFIEASAQTIVRAATLGSCRSNWLSHAVKVFYSEGSPSTASMNL